MDISREANGELNAIIQIKLTEADYIDSVNQQLSDYRKKASMPGFRPGKVPMGMIKKMYGVNVLAEEVNKKVSEGLNNYIMENKLNILGYPLPNMDKTTSVDFDTQKEFDFFFDIGLSPEFDLELNDKIKATLYSIKITDNEVDNAVNDVKVRYGKDENPEKAELTDGVQGKFIELDADGEVLVDGHQNDGFFKIEDMKLKTIQKQLVGKSAASTVDFNLSRAFKDDTKVMSLLNIQDEADEKLKSDYRFEMEKVVRTTEAELGEELYKKLYPTEEITTEEDFRARLTLDLKNHYSRDTDRQLLAESINALLELTNLDLPDEFMKRWLLESNQGKITEEQISEQYESYGKSIRWQLIEGKIQEQFGNDVLVTDEEIRDKVRAYFTQMGGGMDMNPQMEGIIDSVLQNKEEKQRMYHDLQDEKYIKLFKQHLKLKEKEVDSKKFFEIVSETK